MSKLQIHAVRKPKGIIEITVSSQMQPSALLYARQALKLAGEGEKELISFLVREKQFKQSRWGATQLETLPMQKILLNGKAIGECFKLARQALVFFEGKKIQVFPFSRLPIVLKGIDDGASLLITPYVESGSTLMPVEPSSLLAQEGTPPFLYQGSLYFIKETYLKRWLAFANVGERILEELQREDFLDTLDGEEGNPRLPKLILERQTVKKEKKTSLKPLLRLKDERGVFSELFFEYPFGRVKWVGEMQAQADKERMLAEEKSLIHQLKEAGYQNEAGNPASFFCSPNQIQTGLFKLIKGGWQVFSSKGLPVLSQTGESFEVLSGENSLLIRGGVEFGAKKADLASLKKGMLPSSSLVALEGYVGLVEREKIPEQLLEMQSAGIPTPAGIKIDTLQFGLLKNLADRPRVKFDQGSQKWKEALIGFSGLSQKELSSAFDGSLRPYQKEGVAWLEFLNRYGFGGILADEMGLGKTVQVLAFLSDKLEKGAFLFVVPLSLLFNWEREIARFLPKSSLTLHHGPNRAQSSSDLPKKGLILTTYGVMRQDQDLFEQTQFEGIFFDEAQLIKNKRTESAKGAALLKGKLKISLTGTPIENSEQDLISHFSYLMPGLLAKKTSLELLKDRTAPFILKRKKEEVLDDLPPLYEDKVYVTPSDREIKMHGALEGELKNAASGTHALQALSKMRQLASHPSLLDSKWEGESFPKFEQVAQDLQVFSQEGKKVLFFTQYLGILDLLQKRLSKEGIGIQTMSGETKNREEIVLKFQKREIEVLAMTPKVGGYGLNLTEADVVLIYDPWWNKAQEEQAISRTHRIGREHPVLVKRYLLLNSVEEVIEKIQNQKEAISESIGEKGELEGLIARFILTPDGNQ